MRNWDRGINEATSLVVYDRAQFMVIAAVYLLITLVLYRLLSGQYTWFFFEKSTKEDSSCLPSVRSNFVMSFTFVSLASLLSYVTIFTQI